ncbi:MAG: Ig-like domain-containing protein, partial [Anaerolineales bacterium]|nr:Ig-like domain-containing protein [Anaerolineales bacterium]
MNRSVLPISALMFLAACSVPALPFAQSSPTPTKPQVIVTAPISGTSFALGADVTIQSISSDASGIARVDLLVDSQVVRSDTVPGGTSQPQFQIAQTWKATIPGVRVIIVRATNQAGAIGEAALAITITEPPKPTNTPVIPTVAPAPTKPPAAPAPTKGSVAPTTASSGSQRTLTLTEAQVNAIINTAIASGQIEYVSNASVSLQNGQITITANYAPPGLKPISGKIVLTVSASNCTLRVTVISASLGVFTLNDAQKAALGQS